MSKRVAKRIQRPIQEIRPWRQEFWRKRGNREEMPDTLDWDDPDQLRAAKWLCVQSTAEGLSFLARHVLGYNWWDFRSAGGSRYRSVEHKQGLWISQGCRFRTCGLVDWGEHRRMAAALSGGRDVVLFCSRNTNKTTWVMVKCIQTILQNPNIRWIVYMATKDLAEKTIRDIKRRLEQPRLVQLFGEQKGPEWSSDRFEVANRTRPERCSTVQATGAWATSVGDHCDILWTDDPIDFRHARSTERLKQAIDTYQQLQPLLDPGGREIFTLTPYAPGDFAEFLLGDEKTFRSGGRVIVRAPCGFTATHDRRGKPKLVGEMKFPRLTRAFLKHQLDKMQSVDKFNRQYALVISSPEDEVFSRADFIPHRWEQRFRNMCAYVLTDTASSDREDACQSVLAMVLVDWDSTAYIADLRIGKWKPSEFRENFIRFIQDWRGETMITGVAMERVSLNHVYRAMLEDEMRRHGISIPWIELPRGTQHGTGKQGDTKQGRIRALEQRVRARKLRFIEERMTPHALLGGHLVPLYRHNGYDSITGEDLPSGEIVDQFVNWRDRKDYGGIMDIPDCLSAIDQVDGDGRRLLSVSSVRRSTDLPLPGANRGGILVRPHHRQTPEVRRSFWERRAR